MSSALWQATGGGLNSSFDDGSYISELALLLRDGNEYTGGNGINTGAPIYIEHANEVRIVEHIGIRE